MPVLLNFLKKIHHYRYTIASYAVRDIRKRYAGSMVGVFWSVIHPLVMVLTYSIIFSYIFKAKVGEEYAGSNYSMWLLCGLIPWYFFSETVQRSATIILENKNLVTKSIFPSEILPISLLLSGVISHAIGIAIILAALLVTGGQLLPGAAFAVAYFVPFLLFTLGLAWLLAAVNVFVRDVGQLTGIALNLWFFYTPIIYPLSIVPEKYRPFLEINPVYYMVEGYRASFLKGAPPDAYAYLGFVAAAACLFGAGGLFFRRMKPAFPDVL